MDIITVDKAAELLAAAIAAIAAGGFGSAPITVFIVSVLKRIIPEAVVSAGVLQFVTALALTALFWLAGAFGRADLFKNVIDFILVAGPAVIGLLTALSGSSGLYKLAVKFDAGVIGYKRS